MEIMWNCDYCHTLFEVDQRPGDRRFECECGAVYKMTAGKQQWTLLELKAGTKPRLSEDAHLLNFISQQWEEHGISFADRAAVEDLVHVTARRFAYDVLQRYKDSKRKKSKG